MPGGAPDRSRPCVRRSSRNRSARTCRQTLARACRPDTLARPRSTFTPLAAAMPHGAALSERHTRDRRAVQTPHIRPALLRRTAARRDPPLTVTDLPWRPAVTAAPGRPAELPPDLSHRQHASRQHGFTLIEIVVTVVLLALLAAIAIPGVNATVDRTRDGALTAELETLGRAASAYAAFDDRTVDAAFDDRTADAPPSPAPPSAQPTRPTSKRTGGPPSPAKHRP